MSSSSLRLTRVAVFYDGSYFKKVSDYYKYNHERQSRLSLAGMNNFISKEVSKIDGSETENCKVTEAHYFRGRMSTKLAIEQNALEYERKFDEVLMRAGIVQHYYPLDERHMTEKGIDTWLTLEAYDLAIHKGLDIVVLVCCDGDYVPLVKKLASLGVRVMLLAWDITETNTRTSQALIHSCSDPLMMADIIDSRSAKQDPIINGLFIGG